MATGTSLWRSTEKPWRIWGKGQVCLVHDETKWLWSCEIPKYLQTGMKICTAPTSIGIWLWWIQMPMIFRHQGYQWPTRHGFSMISLMWMILHSLICCGGVSCQCKTIANKHGKGFEEQGSSKENMLEKIEESRKTSLKIAGRPEEVYTAAWRFIWGEWCPAGSRGLFKQRGDAVWMVRDCESLSPRWRIHHVERWSWTTPYHPTLYMCPSTKALLSHQEPSQCSKYSFVLVNFAVFQPFINHFPTLSMLQHASKPPWPLAPGDPPKPFAQWGRLPTLLATAAGEILPVHDPRGANWITAGLVISQLGL